MKKKGSSPWVEGMAWGKARMFLEKDQKWNSGCVWGVGHGGPAMPAGETGLTLRTASLSISERPSEIVQSKLWSQIEPSSNPGFSTESK